jgi:hypothetical protein
MNNIRLFYIYKYNDFTIGFKIQIRDSHALDAHLAGKQFCAE